MANITFIGGGNMASAIIGGLLANKTAPGSLRVVEVVADARKRIESTYPGVRCYATSAEAIRDGDVIVLAVKPQQMRVALSQSGISANAHLVVSIAAGITLTTLGQWCGGYTRFVRAMPNTPALVGEGVTALFARSGSIDEADRRQAESILAAVGPTVWVDGANDGEDLMNAVTAISGSGPAYVFLFMEAMEQAAIELKLSSQIARKLVMQTFIGAARLAMTGDEPVAVLRERVTSKGGTTAAALDSMARDQVKAAIVRAINAANERGRELGREMDKG
jgi:pyrroline-5-carboxylate reductase